MRHVVQPLVEARTQCEIFIKFVDYLELTLIRFVRTPNNRTTGLKLTYLPEVSRDIAKTF
jgi:hypothetical protein